VYADIDDFLLDCQSRNLRAASILAYRLQLVYFSKWVAARNVSELGAVTAQTIRAYFADQLERGLSPYTVRMSGRCLRAWFNWAVADKRLVESPMRAVKLPIVDPLEPDFFTIEEVRRLLDMASVRDRALILFLLDTGARLGETAALSVGDVDGAAVRLRTRTKSRRARTVYLGGAAREAMAAYLAERPQTTHDALWVMSTTNKPLTRNGIQEAIKRLGRRAGVNPCAPHRFRRTFAMWSLRAGMDSDAVAKLLGHSDDAMLRFYAQLQDEDLKRAHSKFGPVDTFLK
jgi:integrase/recombinase XerD